MAPSYQKKPARPILLKDLNSCITCSLCSGYLVDATTLIDCLHVFCRACILRHFENYKLGCPTCNVIHKKKSNPFFRPDPIIQSLVYKLVPGLYSKEVQRREDFYRSTGVRASSSCSEDSVLGDINEEHEEWLVSACGDQNQYLSPDDAISLSLEYYQPHLDTTQNLPSNTKSTNSQDSSSDDKPSDTTNNSAKPSADKTQDCDTSNTDGESAQVKLERSKTSLGADEDSKNPLKGEVGGFACSRKGDRRYLQCPAAVTMSHLQKFLRMKYALNTEHRVDIIHSGEVLPAHFSLIDVAYTFKWQRPSTITYHGTVTKTPSRRPPLSQQSFFQKIKPMRFFYRIFTTAKIQPIKIISTSSVGGKQLQVVPAKPNNTTQTLQPDPQPEATKEALTKADQDAQNYRNKERLMANLQLQSKAKMIEKPPHHEKSMKEERGNHKDERLSPREERVSHREDRISHKEDRPSHKEDRPSHKEDRPSHKEDRPSHKEDRLSHKEDRLTHKEDRAVHKEDRLSYKEERPIHKEERLSHKEERLHKGERLSHKEDRLGLKQERIKSHESEEEADCVLEYEEPDKDEIRAFAEKRDREWALQKQLDEEKEKHRNSKKRKKSKHSKGNLLYKKRKLHAEITSSESLQKEESLKLKVKLTPHNGYKHKHHKSSQSQVVEPPPKIPEMSSKEKLLQMRQVRHKHISLEDKTRALYQNNNSSSPHNAEEEKPIVKREEIKSPKLETSKTPPKLAEINIKIAEVQKKPSEVPETVNKATQSTSLKAVETPKATHSFNKSLESSKPAEAVPSGKTLRSDFSNKTNATKELCMQKYPTVQLERNEQTERQAQKTFLKTFQSYTEKFAQSADRNSQTPKARSTAQNTYPGRNPQSTHLQTTKSLEQKIANLHQQCTTVEAKPIVRQNSVKIEKRFNFVEKPQILNSQYPSGFTVSKVEAGVKRKVEDDHNSHDKRPSLEITLINPPVEKLNPSSEFKPTAKRPPPPTIPLERIKKSMNRMPGISIIPKVPERCDNTGALDLSKPNKGLEITSKTPEIHNKILNGLSLLGRTPERVRTPDRNMQLSNLQMLSKVATEHPNINKNSPAGANKRPPIPNLQTLKIPVPQNSTPKSNLAKLPKLNEISKTQFRMPNPQLRNMRPNQSQSVRNIPNPSLLVRQQNQNRLNSLNQSSSGESKEQPAKQASSNSDSTNSLKIDTKEKVTGEGIAQPQGDVEVKVSS